MARLQPGQMVLPPSDQMFPSYYYGVRFDWFCGRPVYNHSSEDPRLFSFASRIGEYRFTCGRSGNRDRHIVPVFAKGLD